MAEYDLTERISPYLDKHLIFPLLEFLEQTEQFYSKDILTTKFKLLQQTSMVDLLIDINHTLNPEAGDEAPADLLKKRAEVVENLQQLQKDSAPIVELLTSEEVQEQVQRSEGDGNMLREYLEKNHGFEPAHLDTLYKYSQILFDIGKYQEAEIILYQYFILSSDPQKTFAALWGKFASAILSTHWDSAMEDLNRLKDYIDNKIGFSPLLQLQQRTWLIHWSLFVFFNHPQGRDGIIDLFLYQPAYSNTIQTVCPWILRYLTTAVITNKKRRGVLKDLVKIIQQESYTYRDPITEFLECLYVKFDFDGAQKKLVECETVLKNDFFLVACRDDFIENARLFIFETYCRIHNTISISQLAIKLNMDEERAEEWIVNLIRDARLDAKIDSKAGHVLMTPQVPSIYHQVIEKTKGLSFRSEALAQDIGRGGGNDPHMNFKIQGGSGQQDGGQQGGGQQDGGGQRGGGGR